MFRDPVTHWGCLQINTCRRNGSEQEEKQNKVKNIDINVYVSKQRDQPEI